jgi:hypothetical protein
VQQDRNGEISVAGALPFMTSFSVDGISTQRIRYGGPSRELFPSVESIEEFKVAMASNSAEFMQVTDLTTTTRSGTNQFHGTAFWFNQDDDGDFTQAATVFVVANENRGIDTVGREGSGPIKNTRRRVAIAHRQPLPRDDFEVERRREAQQLARIVLCGLHDERAVTG